VNRLRFGGRTTLVISATWVVLLVGCTGNSWAAARRHKHHGTTSSSRCRTYKIAHKKIKVCNGLNGAQGPGGPGGPGGPAGPAGPPGNGAFGGELRAGTASTTLFNQNGALIEAACSTGDAETLAVRAEGAEGNHNTIVWTTFAGGEPFSGGGAYFAGGERVPILIEYGGAANGLIDVRTSGGATTSFEWFATPSSDGDCIVGGTASY
jgi:hypothetical protein